MSYQRRQQARVVRSPEASTTRAHDDTARDETSNGGTTHDDRSHDNRSHDDRSHDDRSHDDRSHDDTTIEAAIRALTPGHFKKLRVAAYALMRGLELETAERGHEDLFSEAMARTLSGSRAWRQGVDFMHHLIQAMRSIAWTWREQEDRRRRAGLVDAPHHPGEPANGSSDAMDPPSPAPSAERAYLTARELDRFSSHFYGDDAASLVIRAWRKGESMKELAQRSRFTPQELQWAARRIRRFAQKSATRSRPHNRKRGAQHGD